MKKSVLLLTFLLSAFFSTRADDLLDDVLGGTTALPQTPSEVAAPAAASGTDNAQMQALKAQVAELKFMVESNALARQKEVAQGEPVAKRRPISHIDNPAMLYIRFGGGSRRESWGPHAWESTAVDCDTTFVEIRSPCGKSLFDLSFEWIYSEMENCLVDLYGCPHYREEVSGGRACLLWNPFRGRMFAPYAGIGLQYTDVTVSGVYTDVPYSGSVDDGLSLAFRLGAKLDLKRVFLTGEYIVASGSEQVLCDLSFYLSRRMKLHAFVEKIELNLPEGHTCYGGGLSYDF